jgi:hypothetical protein
MLKKWQLPHQVTILLCQEMCQSRRCRELKKVRVNHIAIVATLKVTISVCTAVLSCDICYGDHVTKVCPNLRNMQTTAIPCGYVVEGLGFYFILVAENPKMINSDDKIVVVRVLEGSLTTDQLAVEPDKLLPGKNKWVIEEKSNDAFTTNLPSSDILNHMVNWGPMDTKTVKGKIRFEKDVENDVYKYEIDKVWV